VTTSGDRIRLGVGGLIAVLVASALTACGGSSGSTGPEPRQDPGLYMAAVVREKILGDYALAWKSLYPAHKRVAPRREYVACESKAPFPGLLERIRVVKVADEPVRVAGEKRKLPSKAVTVRVTARNPLLERPAVVEHTFHAIAVAGRWTWILTPQRFEDYRAGYCPSAQAQAT
jgi:hypothetical protein